MPPKGFKKTDALVIHEPRSKFDEAESRTSESDVKATSLFNDDTMKRILAAIRAGNFRHVAASAAGIGKDTFTKWCVWGREGREPFARFLAEVERSESMWEALAVSSISDAAASQKDWKASAGVLERRSNTRWAQRVRLEVESQIEEFLDAIEKEMSPDAYEQALSIASRLGTQENGSDHEEKDP
jgi:hypothetical protein